MIIYGALFIPLIVAFILYKYFRRKVVWWEMLIPLTVSLAFIVGMKITIEHSQVRSKEYWGSLVERVEYYEDWDEYIHQTCTRTCCCDSKGENCSVESYDCSYVQYHSPFWQIVCTNGETVGISELQYNEIKSKFNNEYFTELNRNYHTNDGDMYYCTWPHDSITAIPVTTLHHYENRVKAADQSVFHFREISKSDIKKYDIKKYPKIHSHFKQSVVIGDSSTDALMSDLKLQYVNGLLGHSKQVRVYILIFKNQSIEAALYQEWYWSGGNKNEFVICIGIDNERKVEWCRPFSWTRSEALKAEIKNYFQNQEILTLQQSIPVIHEKIQKGFVRRSFKEFDYLTVEPPAWAVILTYLATIAINFGISVWVIKNDHQ